MRGAGFLLLIVLLMPAALHAQNENRRGFIGLGIGPSAPFGSFTNESANDSRVGGSTPGYTSTMVNVGYRFRKHWGVAGAFSYSEYSMEENDDDDWWQVAAIAVGPMYSYRLSQRAALDVKAMLGFFALTPVVDSYTTIDGTGSGIGVDVRAAARYDVFRRWAIFAEGGVQSAGVSYTSSGGHTDLRAMISGFGIAYRPAWD